ERLESEFEHQAMNGDATELFVLEKAGIKRPPDLVLALTGDDEDNLVISQISKEKYAVPKVIARVNDPRNQPHFDLLGISPTVCATSSILGLVALLASAALVSQQQQQLSVQPFAQGLRPLTAIASTPAEPKRLYAVEQSGRIVYFVNGRLGGTFIDLRGRITSGGEQGLLSLA